jgi:hypothetical protein
VAYIVNSSPGAGLRSEQSATFPDPKTALTHVQRLWVRGMRTIRIKDTESGEIFDEQGLRMHIARTERRPKPAAE